MDINLEDDDANAKANPEGQRKIRKLNEYKARNSKNKKGKQLNRAKVLGSKPGARQ